ncbi:MAG: hypothetical protein WC858_01735 [Parcubacteria group bacterium]|jgi:hypothetical protein
MNHSKIKVEKVANFGSNEPFIARFGMGLSEIIEATTFDNKDKIKEEIIGLLVECLTPAYAHLNEIRDIENGKKERLLVDLDKAYNALYERLWVAYKDRMQKVAALMGFNLGFLFQNDQLFEQGINNFVEKHNKIPSDFLAIIRTNRNIWQNALAKFRNDFLEHNKLNKNDVDHFFKLGAAETIFNNCWRLVEYILVSLMIEKLHPGIGIAEIPDDKRDPSRPTKFQLYFLNPPAGEKINDKM